MCVKCFNLFILPEVEPLGHVWVVMVKLTVQCGFKRVHHCNSIFPQFCVSCKTSISTNYCIRNPVSSLIFSSNIFFCLISNRPFLKLAIDDSREFSGKLLYDRYQTRVSNRMWQLMVGAVTAPDRAAGELP